MPKAQSSSLTGIVAKGDVLSIQTKSTASGGVTLSITRESPNVDADLSTADDLEEEYFRESGALDLVTGCDKHLALSAYLPGTSRNIARFQERILAIVSELVDYPRQLPFPNYKQLTRNQRAMSTAYYTICNTSSASSITKLLLPTVPIQVQDRLGKISPKFEDLLGLPEPTALEKTRWLVYFDGTVRWEMEDHPDDPFIRRRTDVIVRRGKYVGSSVDYRGGGVRLDRHVSAAMTKSSPERKQLHHQELCQEGTAANLRILASFDRDPCYKPYVPLLETIFMILIGTFAGRESLGRHNPKPCYDLYDKIRDHAKIPDINGDGLNKALSIHQGMVGQAVSRQTFLCINQEIRLDRGDVRLAIGIS
ncbi:hypothetical protein FPCIR_10821 [Fusarium pseudocircinatum]|uniref:Uncharacterized protein n=1 Tax=Fusarium pseudocircinatum TaxID=56676 RepID=A0A8H5KWX2_9HYPO|nr:hypothetical protein FPCIR_10821 [Fusarium pseudocircinatum]